MGIPIDEAMKRGCLRVADLQDVALLERELNEARNSIATLRELRDLDDKLIRERDQLRAEVERLTLKLQSYELAIADGTTALVKQRDQWRECATRLARWLQSALEYCEAIDAEDTVQSGSEALAVFEKLKGNQP